MPRCLFICKDAKQCSRETSTKIQDNRRFCWQHQTLTKEKTYSTALKTMTGGFDDKLLNLPEIGFGTFIGLENNPLGKVERLKLTKNAMVNAITVGYRMFDLAESYNNHSAIAKALIKAQIPRSELYLIGKGDYGTKSIVRTIMEIFGCQPEEVGTGDYYLDLFLWHHPIDLYQDQMEIWDQMSQCKKLGYVINIGVSNVYQKGLTRLIQYVREKDLHLPVVNEIELNLRQQEVDFVEFCRKHEIRVIAYSPLGYANVALNLTDEKVGEIAKKHHASAAQVLLAYTISRGIAVIPSSRDPKKILDNFNAPKLAPQLNMEEIHELAKLDWKFYSTLTSQKYKQLDDELGEFPQ